MNNRVLTLVLLFLCFAGISCSHAQPPSQSTNTPKLKSTSTSTSKPTITSTITTTPVPLPTETPLPTSTPEVEFLQDDFSSKSPIWGECEYCTWQDDELFFGPFPPRGSGEDQVFYIICEACGENMYYRAAADVTYFEGFGGDRTYGILAGLYSDEFLSAGTISTYQLALYETFDFKTNSWDVTTIKRYSAVNPGYGTNRIEVTIKPGASLGLADIYVNVNGANIIVLYGQSVLPTKVGLYLGWHSVGIRFDNFEFEVLKPVDEPS